MGVLFIFYLINYFLILLYFEAYDLTKVMRHNYGFGHIAVNACI